MTAPMPGPRVYDIDEANELIPTFEEAFDKLDRCRESLRTAKIKLNALEMIWGANLNKDDNPDHAEGLALVEEMKSLEEKFSGVVHKLNELGATVKDLDDWLVDVYHVREGRLVFLCWKRGEEAFEAWHHVDDGFADRQAL